MRRNLLFVLMGVACLLGYPAWSQPDGLSQSTAKMEPVTIFQEDFSGTIKSISTPKGAKEWTYSSIVKTALPKSSGEPYLGTSGNDNVPSVFTLSQAISTLGYQDITIFWTGKRNKGEVKLQYSTNGVDYVELPSGYFEDVAVGGVQSTSATDWKYVNKGVPIKLPAALNNVYEIKFQWVFTTADYQLYAIDDIVIAGVPINGTSTFNWNSRLINEDPCASATSQGVTYTVDGVTLNWFKIIPAGVKSTTSVSDAFSPRRAMLISQKGAISTVGGAYTLKLNKAVQDLSLTVMDLDYINNSLDAVVVKGYIGDRLVYLPKEKVRCTLSNSYDPATGRAQGITKEIRNSVEDGDISFTFQEAVDRVEITFYNAYASNYGSTSSGDQGIGISNVTWRSVEVPLPVTLLSFEATKVAQGAQLKWVTGTEMNNDRFVVEKSYDAKTFEAIGEVRGKGNSSVVQTYSFLDHDLQSGVTYYRLTQYDVDGTSESSKVISLTQKENTAVAALALYPNPTGTNHIALQVARPVAENQTFYILNAAGALVKTVELPKSTAEVNVPVQDLPPGIYLVKAAQGSGSASKFVKL